MRIAPTVPTEQRGRQDSLYISSQALVTCITPSLKVKYFSSDLLQKHHDSFMPPQVTSARDISTDEEICLKKKKPQGC